MKHDDKEVYEDAVGSNPWTSMIFPIRDAKLQLNSWDLCRFLCQTLAFTHSMHTIEIFEDDKLQYRAFKKIVESGILPTHNYDELSPEGIFSIHKVERKTLQFGVENGKSELREEVRLDLLETALGVHSNTGVENQMQRVLGKRFPKQTKLRLLFHKDVSSADKIVNGIKKLGLDSKEEEDDSMEIDLIEENRPAITESSLLNEMSPFPNRGRVFIGFSSHQTTGCGFHVSAQFIPTIERENIDLNDHYFAQWNSDLIYMAGALSRLYYDAEFGSAEAPKSKGRKKLAVSKPTTITKDKLNMQLLQSLSFNKTTPASEVSEILSQSFFSSRALLVPTISKEMESKDYVLINSQEAYLPSKGIS